VTRAALVLTLLLLAPLPASAQSRCFNGSVDDDAGCRFAAPRWVGEFTSLSANGLIGGVTAGLVQHFRGGSFRDGFTRGALGGALVYAGKRVAAERFAGAGLLGRLVSAGGASAARNAGAGIPAFAQLTLPIGPVWLDVQPRARRIRARVDAAAVAWVVYGIAEPELALDAGETLSMGTPVFHTNNKLLKLRGDSVHAAGVTNAGIIYLADIPAYGVETARRQAAHERIHVLQEDQLSIQWTDPAATWLAGRFPALRGVTRFLAVNVSTELLRLSAGLIDRHTDRPWELEAIFFAR
jgi:hypothetical protein